MLTGIASSHVRRCTGSYEDQCQFAGVMVPSTFWGVTPLRPLWISVIEDTKFGYYNTGSCSVK